MRDKFVEFCDHLDKQHLKRSALTAVQLKKRIDQSRDSLKIVKKRAKEQGCQPSLQTGEYVDTGEKQSKNSSEPVRG